MNEAQYANHSRDAVDKILETLSPESLLLQKLPSDPKNLGLTPPFFLLSIGKAASGMTEAIAPRWNIPAEMTLTLIPKGSAAPRNYPVLYGEHPLPGPCSIKSTQNILEKISTLPPGTTLISAISGGTSSLLSAPVHQITLEKKVQVITTLMKKGLPIDEINQVRSALSRVKGGKLLNFFHGSESLTIVLSDTPGLPPETVGSGPTIPPKPERNNTAGRILKSLNISASIPRAFRKPKNTKTHRLFVHDPLVIGNTRTVIQKSLPFLQIPNTDTHIWSDLIKGDAQTVGAILASLLVYNRTASAHSQLFIGAGETTVSLGETNGKGGRTLELSLSLAQTLHDGGIHSFVVGALATDGNDGNSGLAGCIIPGHTFGKIQRSKIQDSLWNHNTKPIIQKNGWAIKTGVTGTNLNDLIWVYIPENG